MKIKKSQAVIEDWSKVHSLNYKLTHIQPYQSVVFAELNGVHGRVNTKDLERIYYILEGSGEFEIAGKVIRVDTGDVLTVPPDTYYDYKPVGSKPLKILLFMELWDN